MKKSTVALVLICLLLGGYFTFEAEWGRSLLLRFLSPDRDAVNQMTLAFLEDIRFKDFDQAATYHSPEDQARVDIPMLIERLFKIKPEMLDIMEYEILFVKVDSTGLRARVKTETKVQDLQRKKPERRQLMLYYHRETQDAPWFMILENSLRGDEAEKGKKH